MKSYSGTINYCGKASYSGSVETKSCYEGCRWCTGVNTHYKSYSGSVPYSGSKGYSGVVEKSMSKDYSGSARYQGQVPYAG